jgi:hypothetical protein
VGANDTRIITLSTSIGLVERGKQALRGCTCVYVCVCGRGYQLCIYGAGTKDEKGRSSVH